MEEKHYNGEAQPVTRRECNIRHEEVEHMRQDLRWIFRLQLGMAGAIIVDLIVRLT